MLGSLISAGGSLLGGLFGRSNAYKETRRGVLGQAAGAREAAEKYGFNPLTLLGVSSPLPSQGGAAMGNAFGDALALLADGLSNSPGVGRREALTRENTSLREELTRKTLQPEVPGVYQRMEQQPMIGATNAGRVHSTDAALSGGGDASGSTDGYRPLGDTVAVDPRRPADNEAVRTHSGFITIDNPYAPFQLHVPTLDGDEALGFNEAPAAFWLGLQGIARAGAWVRDQHTIRDNNRAGRTVTRMEDGRLYAQEPPRRPRRYRPPAGLRPEHLYGF